MAIPTTEPGISAPLPANWRGFPAWLLTDGRAEALVVPDLGRVMSFRRRGGEDLLWQMPADEIARYPQPRTGWRNWGGDRTWLAPQDDWPSLIGRAWPPDITWGETEAPHKATILSNGILRLSSPVSLASGIRLVRDHQFSRGEFIIVQTLEKLTGSPVRVAPWSVTCTSVPNETIIAAHPRSAYPQGYHTWPGANSIPRIERQGDFLHIPPSTGRGYKIGVDSPHAAIAACGKNETLILRANRPDGEYPDGPNDAPGFPVEYYTNGLTGDDATKAPMCELELLAPLEQLAIGQTYSFTTQWSILSQPTNVEIYAALTQAIPF